MIKRMRMNNLREFLKLESASGILLVAAAALAMIFANSPLHIYYDMLIELPVEIRVGAFEIAKPLLLWINDGLMAIFFFLVGLELKRELLEGELQDMQSIALPGLAAVGGMLVPALVYIAFNADNEAAMRGWAIPTATDIAFALGILSLLGSRVPISLKVFLVSLAIFDDMGAIIIIAIFYTLDISMLSLSVAATCMVILFWLNRSGHAKMTSYMVVGIIMWASVLKSGVHATLAGVILALFIPIRTKTDAGDCEERSMLKTLESDLHGVVAFAILPIFAFANSGISLSDTGFEQLLHPVPLGIALGLFLGKQVGVFLFCWLSIKLGLAKMPRGANWPMVYGVALITGIGFTMSLFIGSLAFEEKGASVIFDERLGIIIGSVLSAVIGYMVLNKVLPDKAVEEEEEGNLEPELED